MEDVKQQIKELLEHHEQDDHVLQPVLQRLKQEAVARGEALFGAWADMDRELLGDLITGEYRRSPAGDRQRRTDEALDNWLGDDV